MDITVGRAGTFQVEAVAGSPHCGLKEGTNEFRYEIQLTCTDAGLDEHGFVLDNSELQAVWGRHPRLTVSCENLCRVVVQDLRDMFEGRQDSLRKISVAIWGLETAFARAEWTNDDRQDEIEAAKYTRLVREQAQAPHFGWTRPGVGKSVAGPMGKSAVALATLPPSKVEHLGIKYVPIKGNTYPVRAQIKDLGGKWDAASKAWLVPEENAVAARALLVAGATSRRKWARR